jgi:hypothetical protein
MAQSKYHHKEIYRGKDLVVERLSKKQIFILGAGQMPCRRRIGNPQDNEGHDQL